jgi:hypothetical protein
VQDRFGVLESSRYGHTLSLNWRWVFDAFTLEELQQWSWYFHILQQGGALEFAAGKKVSDAQGN